MFKKLLVDFVGNFHAVLIWFVASANPKISIWTSTIVMKIRYVKCFAVEYRDVIAAQTMCQTLKLW